MSSPVGASRPSRSKKSPSATAFPPDPFQRRVQGSSRPLAERGAAHGARRRSHLRRHMPASDQGEIQALLDELNDAWKRGDASAYGARFLPDGTFTNVNGE